MSSGLAKASRGLGRVLGQHGFVLGILAMVTIAMLWPQLGRTGGWLHSELLTDVGVALIFLLHGVSLSTEKLQQGVRNWRLHLLVQLSTFALFPLLWLLVSPWVTTQLPLGLTLGFIYLCALPSTVSSSVAMTAAGRGNVLGAIFNATLSSLLGVVLTPLLVGWLAGSAGGGGDLGDTMWKIARMLLLPMLVGQLLRPWVWSWLAPYKPWLNRVDRGVILLLVLASFSDSVAAGVWQQFGAGIVLITVLGCGALLAVVLWLTAFIARRCRLSRTDEVALVFCGSKKTLASGVPMATLLFGASPWLGMIVLPIMVYHQLQLLICSVLAARYAAQESARTGAT